MIFPVYSQTIENDKEGDLSINQISPCAMTIESDFKLETNLNLRITNTMLILIKENTIKDHLNRISIHHLEKRNNKYYLQQVNYLLIIFE